LTIGQISRIQRITVSIIADIWREKAIRGFVKFAGRESKEIAEVHDVDAANHYIEKEIPVITKDGQVLIKSDVDVILESTGVPEAAAKHIYNAIKNKKNIVNATVEAEVVVDPLLSKMAEEDILTTDLQRKQKLLEKRIFCPSGWLKEFL